jgi:hypothetical protein
MATDFLAERRRIAKERKNIGLRQQAAESVQNLLAAAAIQQPIMHEGRAHVFTSLQRAGRVSSPSHRLFTPVTEGPVIFNVIVTLRPDVETHALDPLLQAASLPYAAEFFPSGFHLIVRTNSHDVLAAAAECWSGYVREFQCEPVELHVITRPQGALSPEPAYRWQHHLLSIIGDVDNFAVADLERLFSFAIVSARTAADHAWLRWFFVETIVYALLAQRHAVPVHGACVARNGSGILLCGVSGAGKSTLSFACALQGWTFISDDCTWLLPDSENCEAVGRPREARFRPDAPLLFPELEGLAERARPNGKIGLAVRLSEFPRIPTASRCAIGGVAFLERTHGGTARIARMPGSEALEELLADRPSYGPAVDARHERTIRRLMEVPAYRLQYQTVEDGVRLVARLADGKI